MQLRESGQLFVVSTSHRADTRFGVVVHVHWLVFHSRGLVTQSDCRWSLVHRVACGGIDVREAWMHVVHMLFWIARYPAQPQSDCWAVRAHARRHDICFGVEGKLGSFGWCIVLLVRAVSFFRGGGINRGDLGPVLSCIGLGQLCVTTV